MDINKVFEGICLKVEETLSPQGFAKQKISGNDNELVSLYTSENSAYSIVYFMDKQHMVMRHCAMTEDGPDNNWRVLATWMFDPEHDTQKEADSIANDFVDNCSGAVAAKRLKATKKKKKKNDDDGNADPLFLSKRFVAIFPELKEEIKTEEDCYYPFRSVTFMRASVVPKVNDYVARGTDKDIEKLAQLLNTQYANGDADTRSIITIVILNALPESDYEKIAKFLDEDLSKASKAALKFKGKKVKPEKPKKKKKSIVERLQARQ